MNTLFWIAFTAIVTAVGVSGTLYFTQIRPAIQQHKKHEAERDQKRRDSDTFMFGGKTLEGEEIVSAPRRMRALELSVSAVVSTNRQVAAGQGVLEKRMDEANGTMRDIKNIVTGIAGRPPATVAEVKEIAERQTQILDALTHQENP